MLVLVEAFGSTDVHPYTVTTIRCGDCCNFQLTAHTETRNMGSLKKLKFLKKRQQYADQGECKCVHTGSTDLRCCNGMDPNVMCPTHTETRMDGSDCGGCAVKDERECELEKKNQNIQKLEDEVAVSKRLTADLMLNTNSVKQQVTKYAEQPVIWSDDCEC